MNPHRIYLKKLKKKKTNMTDSSIVSKIWNLASVLRDDGVGYGDYLEQITYLLFLKNGR
jgi:type I restriction-modification system DNA methylase subunit